ncbi:MAG: hypothetical protein IJ158_05360 [Treponema sp.]|nr:hypothetical protein [Treponema sp.]
MTNTNKEKIMSLIAQAHIGDSCFEKKYGFKINVGDVTEENLDEKNREYQAQFLAELEKKLDEENLPDSFFYDLLFSTPSIPAC